MGQVDELLGFMSQLAASDLHLRSNCPPRFRVSGLLQEYEGFPALSATDVHRLVGEILTREQELQFEASEEVDFSYDSAGVGRFRCNYFKERRGPAAVFRRIAQEIPTLESLGLPEAVGRFAHLRSGLVLVTGPTGSGKSSTLAALIGLINATYAKHIVTLEDPIEFAFESQNCLIHQRGLHQELDDFRRGLFAAMREDADVIMVGELRDPETMRLALSAAEMGALVFATLHTNGASETVDRIIDAFPGDEQYQIRAMLAQSLKGVVSQVLLTLRDETGRVPATEILVGIPAVSNLIREGKTRDIENVLQSGRRHGMHSMDDSLDRLLAARLVDPAEAVAYARNKGRFERLLTG
jgi:twitching motility protein PilT